MRRPAVFAAVCVMFFVSCVCAQQKQIGRGHSPTALELHSLNITVLPDGSGLPAGSGTAIEGEKVYQDKCASCHGNDGQGNEPLGSRLVGGFGTLKSDNPILTVGSYWPYATTAWDYIHRAMPYPQPGTLTANETYALTAFLLYKNGIIKETDVMNGKTLPKVKMPNRDGFIPDRRPDITCSKQQESGA